MKQLLMKFMTSAVAAAPAASADAPGQQELFPEGDPVQGPGIPIGAIVMPLITEGLYQTSYLYFQVRQAKTVRQSIIDDISQQHPKWDEKKRAPVLAKRLEDYAKLLAIPGSHYPSLDSHRYQIEGVPYGFRITEAWIWLEESLLFDTGLRWGVPDHRELDAWNRKAHPYPKDAVGQTSGQAGYDRWFLSTYHTPMNRMVEHPDTPPEKKQQYHYDNRPYKGERELVRMLESLHDSDIRIYPRWDAVMSRTQYIEWIDERILPVHKKNLERRKA